MHWIAGYGMDSAPNDYPEVNGVGSMAASLAEVGYSYHTYHPLALPIAYTILAMPNLSKR